MSKSARERAREWMARPAAFTAEPNRDLIRDLLAEADRLQTMLDHAQVDADQALHDASAQLAAARAEAERLRGCQAQALIAQREAEEAKAKFEAVLQEARCWAGEAKSQRATVNEVGSVLGGVPDWGPIATKVASLRARLERADKLADAAEAFSPDKPMLTVREQCEARDNLDAALRAYRSQP